MDFFVYTSFSVDTYASHPSSSVFAKKWCIPEYYRHFVFLYQTTMLVAVLRIRDVYPGSGSDYFLVSRIPDPDPDLTVFYPGSRI
jgi:hypothetical protein